MSAFARLAPGSQAFGPLEPGARQSLIDDDKLQNSHTRTTRSDAGSPGHRDSVTRVGSSGHRVGQHAVCGMPSTTKQVCCSCSDGTHSARPSSALGCQSPVTARNACECLQSPGTLGSPWTNRVAARKKNSPPILATRLLIARSSISHDFAPSSLFQPDPDLLPACIVWYRQCFPRAASSSTPPDPFWLSNVEVQPSVSGRCNHPMLSRGTR